MMLVCPFCNFRAFIDTQCPMCGASIEEILKNQSACYSCCHYNEEDDICQKSDTKPSDFVKFCPDWEGWGA